MEWRSCFLDRIPKGGLALCGDNQVGDRYLCGPRLASELTGPARASIANKKAQWLSTPDGVHRLLKHLQGAISEPVLPEVGNTLRAYFKHLRRRKGETMTSFCVRHREEYERVCRALSRMVKDQKPHVSDKRTRSRRTSWQSVATQGRDISGPVAQANQCGTSSVERGSCQRGSPSPGEPGSQWPSTSSGERRRWRRSMAAMVPDSRGSCQQ